MIRGYHLDQPIVENFVGRQIPTAMVARNLDRGSGFFRPQLDTGPFPNLFLVEPPIYAQGVVFLERLTGLSLTEAGRLLSSLGLLAGGWGLYGLTKRRSDPIEAGLATLILGAVLPVFLRYGRAVQPDALMIGVLVLSLRLWDDHENERGRVSLILAWVTMALGFALKVTSAGLLLPLLWGIFHSRSRIRLLLVGSTLLPALCWYLYVFVMLSRGDGSRASSDNAVHWLRALSLTGLLEPKTYLIAGRIYLWRAFSPLGSLLAIWGFLKRPRIDRLWSIWAITSIATLLAVAGKIHHEYYALMLGPVVSVGIARALSSSWKEGSRSEVGSLHRQGRIALSFLLSGGLVAFAVQAEFRTIDTPSEWKAWSRAVAEVDRHVPAGEWIVAPEAILFLADRKGCRLEADPAARSRAAGEWGGTIDPENPVGLVEFYRGKGARFVVDLVSESDDLDRRLLHDAIRRRYNVLIDRDGVILADLSEPRLP